MTTFGYIFESTKINHSVGELSAAAGIAGSYCEYVRFYIEKADERCLLSMSSVSLPRLHKCRAP